MTALDIKPPTEAELIEDLKVLRRRGITKLAYLELPALHQAVRASARAEADEAIGAFMVEAMLRDAVAEIGGDLGEAAEILFGLTPGGRSDRPSELRKLAAETMHVVPDHFRRTHEIVILEQVVQLLLTEIYRHRLQLARLQRDVRTPVGSRLAVEWLHRFEAMYEIWTPITGVGNDLTAYRSTLLEEDRPWDRAPDPDDPDDEGYSQEIQAAGCATSAFFHFALVLAAERRFCTRFGGLWLLPDAQAETDIADAIHRIRLASPNNEVDDSLMRQLVANAGSEMISLREATRQGDLLMTLHDEWQDWVSHCRCEWKPGERVGRKLFPSHRNHPNIDEQCDVHILIAACNDYCLTLDDAWDQIADWYRDVPKPKRVDVTAEEIYEQRDDPLPRHERKRRE